MQAIWSVALARPLLVLVLLCLAVLLPGLTSLPPTDRDEGRYVQATRQMIETGDYVEIRFQDEARNKKPVLIYWLQAGANLTLGTPPYDAVWIYRLPSVLGATLAVLFTFFIGCLLFSREVGLLGAGLFAASLLLIVEGHIAKTDAMLLATILGAQWALASVYLARARAPSWGVALGFWVALGLGILVKGPVAPFIVGATAATLALWRREARWLLGLKPVSGLLVLAALVLPWGIAIWVATDGAFFREALGGDFGGKLIGGQEKHGLPVPVFWASVWLFLWPAALFLAPAIGETWRQRLEPEMQVLIAWVVPAWIVFELVPTKLPHYPLPLYPALALAAAVVALAAARAPGHWRRRLTMRLSVGLYVLMGLALTAALAVLPALYGQGLPPWPVVVLAPLIAAGIVTVAAGVLRGRIIGASLGAIAVAGLWSATLFAVVVPELHSLRTSPRAAALVREVLGPDHAPVAVAGYAEPSLVFLLGTATRLGPGAAAAEHLAAAPRSAALVEEREEAAFRAALAARGLAAVPAGRLEGFNYSKGDWIALTLYRLPPAP